MQRYSQPPETMPHMRPPQSGSVLMPARHACTYIFVSCVNGVLRGCTTCGKADVLTVVADRAQWNRVREDDSDLIERDPEL